MEVIKHPQSFITEGSNILETLLNPPEGNSLIYMLRPAVQPPCKVLQRRTQQSCHASPSAKQEMYLWEWKWDTGTSCCVIKLLRASTNTLLRAQMREITFIHEIHSALSVQDACPQKQRIMNSRKTL